MHDLVQAFVAGVAGGLVPAIAMLSAMRVRQDFLERDLKRAHRRIDSLAHATGHVISDSGD